MRVKELADLAGTTVRTVRHYHHVGLLEVPATVGGVREYQLEHLARLLRIRWLVSAGLGLPAIREVLEPDAGGGPGGALADLERTLTAIDDQLTQLQAQRERIVALIERVAADGSVTPLPAALSRMYDRLAERMPARARFTLAAERRIASIMAVRGILPPALEDLVARLTPEDEDLTVELFVAFAELGSDPVDDERFDANLAMWREFIDRHEGEIAEVLRQLSGPRGVAFTLIARLTRLAYPSRTHTRLLERLVDEARKNPRLLAALDERRR